MQCDQQPHILGSCTFPDMICSVSSEAIIQRKPSSPKLLGQRILPQEQKKTYVLHVETAQLLLQFDMKIYLVEVAFRVVVSINSLCALLSSDSSDHIQNTSLNVLSFILCHACCPAPHGCPLFIQLNQKFGLLYQIGANQELLTATFYSCE